MWSGAHVRLISMHAIGTQTIITTGAVSGAMRLGVTHAHVCLTHACHRQEHLCSMGAAGGLHTALFCSLLQIPPPPDSLMHAPVQAKIFLACCAWSPDRAPIVMVWAYHLCIRLFRMGGGCPDCRTHHTASPSRLFLIVCRSSARFWQLERCFTVARTS